MPKNGFASTLDCIATEAYHLEAFNFPYLFQAMLPIIPDQWKSLF